MTGRDTEPDPPDLSRERWDLLQQLNGLLEVPMIVLSFVWLGLTIIDLTTGLSPTLEVASYVIWGLFALQFLLGIVIAPSRVTYVRHNWLTALALLLPAFRVLRVFRAFRLLRAARAARSLSLVRLITSLNRGMRAIGSAIGGRGVGYVVALTAIVTFAGAAGMARFESPDALRESGYLQEARDGAGLSGYGEALWWTAMIMTTMGSEYWPKTLEGRILGWLLALYAFAIFGYITATIASFFIGQDAERGPRDGDATDVRQEVIALRAQVAALTELLAARGTDVRDISGSQTHEQPHGRQDNQRLPVIGPGTEGEA